jgi:hypothetical protein
VTIKTTSTAAIKRTYPHVNEVEDWRAQQTIRLLWDRLHDLTEQLQALQATTTQLVDGHNANETAIATASQDARQALSISQQIGGGTTLPGGGGGGEGGITVPGEGDGGQAQIGCASAGATGHDSGGLLNAVRAGHLACGTAHEFPAYLNAAPDEATRNTNAETLLRRMIWHLRLGGFTAGRQKNPSGAISNDKLCVTVDGTTRVYDMFVGKGNFSAPMSTSMREAGMPNMIDDVGIPD